MLASESSAKTGQTIGEYLIARLHALGVGHVFGIPGDYVLGFYDQLVASELKVVTVRRAGRRFRRGRLRARGLGGLRDLLRGRAHGGQFAAGAFAKSPGW